MRIRLSLIPATDESATVPVNYQYPLSAAIYGILREAAPAYADFLHQKGYRSPDGRLMKLFTFSKLWIPDVRIRGTALTGSAKPWRLSIGSPFQEEFVQNVVRGLFFRRRLTLAGNGLRADFDIAQIKVIPRPEFSSRMAFKCLSPVVVSTMHEHRGKLHTHYLPPDAPEFSELIRKNLLQKYQIIHGRPPEDPSLHFRVKSGGKIRSRLISIKPGTAQETRIRAFETYFLLEGNPELMATAWDCGIGEHNSQGFGMIDPL